MKLKIKRTGEYTSVVECPECRESISLKFNRNKWTNSFKAECDCGWKFLIKQEEIDSFQPNHPLFELYYRYKIEEGYREKEKLYKENEGKRKEALSSKYRARDPIQKNTRKLTSSEIRRLEQEVLED